MADSASESDSGSVDGGPIMMPPSPATREQMQKRIESLQQQNRVLKAEIDAYKVQVKTLQSENRSLRQASVNIHAKAEQEEEYISNTLMKKIHSLKKEKETLALNFEQEEECLTNDLSRKLMQLRHEKVELEQSLEREQGHIVNKLMKKIEKLEAEINSKQNILEQLRREKVELENTLEQEQEALVNRLWKRMEKLEAEKRMVVHHLCQPIWLGSQPGEEQGLPNTVKIQRAPEQLTSHIQMLRSEVSRLRRQLAISQQERKLHIFVISSTFYMQKTNQFQKEEQTIREENLRLQRRLQLEMERREALCRHLSESESSLEMEEERHYNEMHVIPPVGMHPGATRGRSTSSPGPQVNLSRSPNSSRPHSPALYGRDGAGGMPITYDNMNPSSPISRCSTCGQVTPSLVSSSPPQSKFPTSVRRDYEINLRYYRNCKKYTRVVPELQGECSELEFSPVVCSVEIKSALYALPHPEDHLALVKLLAILEINPALHRQWIRLLIGYEDGSIYLKLLSFSS
nr:EOG090X09V8 [Artemia franciscana]